VYENVCVFVTALTLEISGRRKTRLERKETSRKVHEQGEIAL